MNKKVLIVSLCAILGISGSTFVFANLNTKEQKLMEALDLTKTTTMDQSYIKLDAKNIDEGKYIKIANQYLTDFKLTNNKLDNSKKITVSIYQNNLETLQEIVISNSDMIVKLNGETGELLSYINQKTSFAKNTLSKDSVKEKALDLFENFAKLEDYELISLEEFDDEIYLAKFCKKYGEYYNPGELISFSFAPQTSEIVTFSSKKIPFAKNEIKLSTDDARTIAKKYLEKSVATEMTISLDIVMPNYGLNDALLDGRLYKHANQTRLAYVCSFNNEAQTKIYIDCTTGEAIGTSRLLGGEF